MVSTNREEYSFKVILLGDSGVGKTSFSLRAAGLEEMPRTTFRGFWMPTARMVIDNCPIKLEVWDTFGQERYRALSRVYYQGAHAIVLMYDITESKSFDNIFDWYNTVKENLAAVPLLYLVGNKTDLAESRVVPLESASRAAEELEARFFETSVKKASDFNDIVLTIVKDMKDKTDNKNGDHSKKKLGGGKKLATINESPQKRATCC